MAEEERIGLAADTRCCKLALFAWLLTLHPTAAGRVYAVYGGVYVATAIVWLWLIDGARPTVWDLTGATVALAGMAIIIAGAVQLDRSEALPALAELAK